jgi:hypothetical protein
VATETANLKLKIIDDVDQVGQDLINENMEILDGEIQEIKNTLGDVSAIRADLDQAETDIATLSGRITNNAQNISNLATEKEDKANKGQPDGYASLDASGKVPITQLPANVKEMRVVADIAARNAITGADLYDGLRVRVLDATGDESVASGWAEYVWDATATAWIKLSEKESLDIVLKWENIQDVPEVLTNLGESAGKLTYNGQPVYIDTRAVTFIGGESEIPYPWAGTIQQIRINCAEVRAEDLVFSVETQAKADYMAKAGNWLLVGGVQLTLPAGEVYAEFTPATNTIVAAGDVIRASTVGDDTGVTFQVIIRNN